MYLSIYTRLRYYHPADNNRGEVYTPKPPISSALSQ